jgi:hypothetical protein
LDIDLATKTEFVPKSISLEIETKRVVISAYFPKESRSKTLATAARKAKPNSALKTFPKPTNPTFANDLLNTEIY